MTGAWPSIDHSLLSPSGRMSKRARAAAMERERVKLFGKEGLQPAPTRQPSERQRLLWRLRDLRSWVAAGMRPRVFGREIAQIEARLTELPDYGETA